MNDFTRILLEHMLAQDRDAQVALLQEAQIRIQQELARLWGESRLWVGQPPREDRT